VSGGKRASGCGAKIKKSTSASVIEKRQICSLIAFNNQHKDGWLAMLMVLCCAAASNRGGGKYSRPAFLGPKSDIKPESRRVKWMYRWEEERWTCVLLP
jgi:hypothetical protein